MKLHGLAESYDDVANKKKTLAVSVYDLTYLKLIALELRNIFMKLHRWLNYSEMMSRARRKLWLFLFLT